MSAKASWSPATARSSSARSGESGREESDIREVIAWQGAFVSRNLCHWREVRRPGWLRGLRDRDQGSGIGDQGFGRSRRSSPLPRVRFLHHNQGMTPDATVTVTREDGEGVQEFVLRVDGDRLGSLDFALPEAGVMRIDYVEVAPELRGLGMGRKLVAAAANWARETGLKIVPDLRLRPRGHHPRPGDEQAARVGSRSWDGFHLRACGATADKPPLVRSALPPSRLRRYGGQAAPLGTGLGRGTRRAGPSALAGSQLEKWLSPRRAPARRPTRPQSGRALRRATPGVPQDHPDAMLV